MLDYDRSKGFLKFSCFTDNFFLIKLLRWDGCFTVTLAPLGCISYLYPVLNRHQTNM